MSGPPTPAPQNVSSGIDAAASQEHPSIIRLTRPYLLQSQIDYLRNLSGNKGPQLDQLRAQALAHIMAIATHFKFPMKTINTSMVLFQKSILYNRVVSVHDLVVACVLVASKMEDTPKKAIEILQCSFDIRNLGQLPEDTPRKRQVLSIERQILETIGFDFRVRHAHYYITPICKTEGDKISHSVAQTAWDVATDALLTDVTLKYPAHSIAFASIVLAAKIKGENIFPIEPTNYCTERHVITEILLNIVDFYIKCSLKNTQIGETWREVGKLFSWREKFSKELKPKKYNPAELSGVKMRDGKFDRQGTVRYILDWEKDHVSGELIS